MGVGAQSGKARAPGDGRALRDEFTDAMAATASGVTVVTTIDRSGHPFGQTVSAMCSVSADPPLLLACINQRSPLADAISRSGTFGVNVLAAHHAGVADTFAGRPRAGDPWDFGCAEWEEGSAGPPILCDAAATFECRVYSLQEFGTHVVFIGSVIRAARREGNPLVYADRAYQGLRMLPV